MKPPVRTRSAPARYETGPAALPPVTRTPWTAKEKRHLIKALKAQAPQGELRVELLREYLPRRGEAEILAFIHQLKGRVAREAIRTEYRRCLEEYRHKKAEVLAPIEVWTDLAEKLTDKLEETVTAAFSQKLTRPARKKVPTDLLSQQESSPAPGDAAGSGDAVAGLLAEAEIPGTSTEPGGEAEKFSVDFEKIYKYLSMLSKDMKVPELSPYESAVLLDLLMSLPDELSNLDYDRLKSHMHRSYKELTARLPNERRKASEPGASVGDPVTDTSSVSIDGERPPTNNPSVRCMAPAELAQPSDSQARASNSGEQEQSTQEPPLPSVSLSTTHHSAFHGSLPLPLHSTTAAVQNPVWKDLGVCPLNLFLVPLELLARNEDSLD